MAAEKQYSLFFLNDYFDNDIEAILPILKMYLEETPKELLNIENCLRRGDTASAKAGTHKIKTNISMLSIRDQSSFVHDMHLLPAAEIISVSIMDKFEVFKSTVEEALTEIKYDYFETDPHKTGM